MCCCCPPVPGRFRGSACLQSARMKRQCQLCEALHIICSDSAYKACAACSLPVCQAGSCPYPVVGNCEPLPVAVPPAHPARGVDKCEGLLCGSRVQDRRQSGLRSGKQAGTRKMAGWHHLHWPGAQPIKFTWVIVYSEALGRLELGQPVRPCAKARRKPYAELACSG